MSTKSSKVPTPSDNSVRADPGLLSAVRQIWEGSRAQAARSVNTALVQANWLIGRQIVEAQQAGQARAGYGEELLENLSAALQSDYGSGFSVSALKYKRQFYLAYPELIRIRHAVRDELAQTADSALLVGICHTSSGESDSWKPGLLNPAFSWSHYRVLLKVERREARDFYEIEAVKSGWSSDLDSRSWGARSASRSRATTSIPIWSSTTCA